MFHDAQKYIKRKINKIEYKNVTLPEEYETTETEYKKVRDNIGLISSIIKTLATYEHGGEIMKNFNSLTNLVASKSNINALKRDDIYTRAGLVGEILYDNISDDRFKKEAKKFYTGFMKISESKIGMNLKLRELKETIFFLKKKAKEIDEQRVHTLNLRYDLEEGIQSEKSESGKIGRMQAEYNSVSKTTLTKMVSFIGEEGLSGILQRIMKINREFGLDVAGAFENS